MKVECGKGRGVVVGLVELLRGGEECLGGGVVRECWLGDIVTGSWSDGGEW